LSRTSRSRAIIWPFVLYLLYHPKIAFHIDYSENQPCK